MNQKLITPLILLMLLVPFISRAQNQTSFAKHVNDCYSKTEFKDIMYRLEHEKECYIGLEFPDFQLPDLQGNTVNKSHLINKVVVMNFWFTACPPCLEEIPGFNKLIEKIDDDDIVFLAPSTDNEETLHRYSKQYGALKSIVLPNSLHLLRDILGSKSGFPTTIVIDRKGIIRKYHSGGIIDFDKFEAFVVDLKKEE